MFFLKAAYCRIFQTALRIALPILPYREPKIICSCQGLDQVIEKENISSILIVTDPGILQYRLIAPLERLLKSWDVPYAIYAGTQPNPTVENVEDALQAYRENHCDALIAVGGGSAMDCAKAVGARVAYPKKSVGEMKGILRVLRKLPPLIAIPTTAGTGSETTLAAVITDPHLHHKYALMSFPLIPHYAVLDPTLTYSLPAYLTSTTGMDALTHAVEAYIGRSTTKETRKLALEATKLIFENIETAYQEGTNHQARKNMLHAAYKAGVAFSKSYVGYIHAIAHSLGGQYGIPHGLANAVVMPYVLDQYGKSAAKPLHELGIAAGVTTADDLPEVGARKFIAAIRQLNANMKIPNKLIGIQEADIEQLAKRAEQEANPLYPVPKLLSAKQLEQFYFDVADWSEANEKRTNPRLVTKTEIIF